MNREKCTRHGCSKPRTVATLLCHEHQNVRDELARVSALEQENARLAEDFLRLGNAFTELYPMALNGAVCDPCDENCCELCANFWKVGRAILDKHDEHWGNLTRKGLSFQPAALNPEQEGKR